MTSIYTNLVENRFFFKGKFAATNSGLAALYMLYEGRSRSKAS